MKELREYALTIATYEELKEVVFIFLHGKSYTFEELFLDVEMQEVIVEDIEYSPQTAYNNSLF